MPTFLAGGPSIRGLGAVTDKSAVLLQTPPSVVAQAAGTAAVTRATRTDPRGHLGPLLQVEGHTVDGESSDAPQETPLSRRRPS